MKFYIKSSLILLLNMFVANKASAENYSFSNRVEIKNNKEVWNILIDVNNWNKWDTEVEYSKLLDNFTLNAKGVIKAKNSPEANFFISEFTPNQS